MRAFTKYIKDFLYEVIEDEWDDGDLKNSFDFGNKEENDAYLKQFEDGELVAYIVHKYSLKDGEAPEMEDSLFAVHATSPEEALQSALICFGCREELIV